MGTNFEGQVIRLATFGAFVQLAEGIEGLVHISEITADRRIAHPSDVLRTGEIVKAKVLGLDPDKRQIKLSIKQLAPTDLDDFLTEHQIGDLVSGRVVGQAGEVATIELGEGVIAACDLKDASPVEERAGGSGGVDLSSLTSLLEARWKGQSREASPRSSVLQVGQVRSFRIAALDHDAKTITVELA